MDEEILPMKEQPSPRSGCELLPHKEDPRTQQNKQKKPAKQEHPAWEMVDGLRSGRMPNPPGIHLKCPPNQQAKAKRRAKSLPWVHLSGDLPTSGKVLLQTKANQSVGG